MFGASAKTTATRKFFQEKKISYTEESIPRKNPGKSHGMHSIMFDFSLILEIIICVCLLKNISHLPA